MVTNLYVAPTAKGTLNLSASTVDGEGYIIGTNGATFAGGPAVWEGRVITVRTPAGDYRTNVVDFINAAILKVNASFPYNYTDCYYYLDPQRVDLYDDIAFPLNFAIADVRTPDQKDTSYSKTIKVPGSKSNNRLFGHAFEIDIDGEWNPHIKALAELDIDTIEQFRGICQLKQVNVLEGGATDYEITLFGTTASFLFPLQDKRLRDLDLSEFNHNFTVEEITNSWDSSIQRNGLPYNPYTGPVSEGFPSGSPDGVGYVYPLVDIGYSDMSAVTPVFYKERMVPCVYVKTLVDKMFEASNHTYTSAFFDGEIYDGLFKKLVVPCGQWRRRATMNVRVTGQQVTSGTTAVAGLKLIKQEDIGGPISMVSFKQVAIGATFQINWSVNLDIFPSDIYWITFGASVGTGVPCVLQAGPTATYWETKYTDLEVGNALPDYGFRASVVSGQTTTAGLLGNGDLIEFADDSTSPNYNMNPGSGGFATFNSFSPIAHKYLLGVWPLQTVLPDKVTCADFFMSLCKLFNLYLDRDKNNSSNIICEPRDQYYLSGRTLDWTYKLDDSKEMTFVPLGELDFKKLKYTYKEDGDFWGQFYKKKYNEIYGQREVAVESDFMKKDKSTELIFAATPSVESKGNGNIIVPSIIKEDPVTVTVGLTSGNNVDSSVPRILLYTGMKSAGSDGFEFDGTPYYSYPSCGMWDSTDNPTYSILFGLPREVYFSTTATVDQVINIQDMYYLGHSTYVQEVADKDSRIVTAYFKLNPVDVFNLNFANIIFVDGHHLRLNKIFDYDAVKPGVTKVEFIKVKKKKPFNPSESTNPPIDPGVMYNVVEGGENEVRDSAASSFYSIIEGGENEVISLGASSAIKIIKG